MLTEAHKKVSLAGHLKQAFSVLFLLDQGGGDVDCLI